MNYEYRVRRGIADWHVDRRWPSGGWVSLARIDNEEDAETVLRALQVMEGWDGQHQWFRDEDQPQCVRCGVRYRRDIPPCSGHH